MNKTITPGQIFQLGRHRLVCGDAADTALVTQLLGGSRVDLILTDPPYGVSYVEGKKGFSKLAAPESIAGDHLQSDSEYRAFTSAWLGAVRSHLATPNSAYVFQVDKMLFALRDGLADSGFKLGQVLIWLKQQPVLGRMDYNPQHELIAYAWRGSHRFQKGKDRSVLFYPRPHRSPHHPTQKPIRLLRHLILNSSERNGLVYDPFLGSGSTLLGCEQTKRRCAGIELEPKHCQTVITRFERLTGIEAVEVTDG